MKTLKETINNLHLNVIDLKPVYIDWSECEMEIREPVRCEKCGEIFLYSSGETHCDLDCDSDCEGYVPTTEGPMMNYAYELPRVPADSAVEKLAHLSVCIVDTSNECYLALTGGGMDLSWEICEAFILLGYLPPVHFANLPKFAGLKLNKRTKLIIKACEKSVRIKYDRMKYKMQDLKRLKKQLKEQ